MTEQPTNAKEKYEILKSMQEKFLELSQEYKAAKSVIEAKVEERDASVAEIAKEQKLIEAKITSLTKLGEQIDAEMKQSIGIYDEGVELLAELSSNDLTSLVTIKTPDADIVAVMDGVMMLLGKEKGWANTCSVVCGKDFMYSISQFNYETLEEAQLAKAAECRNGFDPATIKAKDKSASAFAVWVDGICRVRKLHDEKVPKLQALQNTINANTKAFDAKREGINGFQLELKAEGESCNEKAKQLLALKEEMEKISKITFA